MVESSRKNHRLALFVFYMINNNCFVASYNRYKTERNLLSDHHDYGHDHGHEHEHEHEHADGYNPVHTTGWTPSEFPNPLLQPDLCNIESPMSTSTNDQNVDPHASQEPRLLLCDPDGIFSDVGIRRIADALHNFTKQYGDGHRYNYNYGHRYGSGQEQDQYQDAHAYAYASGKEPRTPRLEKSSLSSLWSTTFQFDNSRVIHPEIAVAIASKMDLPDILHDFAFYSFEDEDDMINDAAQYFASYLHMAWFGRQGQTVQGGGGGVGRNHGGEGDKAKSKSKATADGNESKINSNFRSMRDRDVYEASEANGILIFISVADRVCFISSGNGIVAVLPWWRLERVVGDMKGDMRSGDYFDAITSAVQDVSMMLDEGPPTASEKAFDFFGRFGVVMVFSVITLFLALFGEYRDRKKKYEDAEILSEMDDVEETKARILQKAFKTECCPICLEDFDHDHVAEDEEQDQNQDQGSLLVALGSVKVDSYGIPLLGSDGEELKILRCGHVFDHSCWSCWITSGACADPSLCPVCRADIAKAKKENDDDGEAQMSASAHLAQDDEGYAYGTFENDQQLLIGEGLIN